jgi:hypothetical protein
LREKKCLTLWRYNKKSENSNETIRIFAKIKRDKKKRETLADMAEKSTEERKDFSSFKLYSKIL